MSKCIECGVNFVTTPEQPLPDGQRCRYCEIKSLCAENAALKAEVERLREALKRIAETPNYHEDTVYRLRTMAAEAIQ